MKIKIVVENNQVNFSYSGITRSQALMIMADIIMQHATAFAQSAEKPAIMQATADDLERLKKSN